MMFNHINHQEQLLNNSNSSTTGAHQLTNSSNSPNASFQINSSSNHYEEQMNLSQTYTNYNSLSNHHHTNPHSNSSTVLNSYYNSTANNFQTTIQSQTNELANSRLMNNFINDNYSLVAKNSSSVYSVTNSANHHFNHLKPNSNLQKTNLLTKINAQQPSQHQQQTTSIYSNAGINQISQIDNSYVTKKAAVYNNLNNTTINHLNNFKSPNQNENNLPNSLLSSDHNLDLIKNSISYFNEAHHQYHQFSENSSNSIDIKPKITSIYNDLNRNPILFGLTKNCHSQIGGNDNNEFSSSSNHYTTSNKLIQSLNSTGSTCSTISTSPTLSN